MKYTIALQRQFRSSKVNPAGDCAVKETCRNRVWLQLGAKPGIWQQPAPSPRHGVSKFTGCTVGGEYSGGA